MHIKSFSRYDTSFCKQLDAIESKLNINCLDYNKKIILDLIESLFECENKGIVDSVSYLFFVIKNAMLNGGDYVHIYDNLNFLLKFCRLT